METQTTETTLIQLNRRHSKIITSYLIRNNYQFTVSDSSSDSKVRIEIENLNPEAAFYLGVNTQVQLLDGEIIT